MRLQGAPQKPGKTRQLKQPDIELAAATLRPLSKEPTQPLPYVEQQNGQSHQQKTVGRIGRSRPASDLACTAVTGLNTEAAPIETADLAGRHVQMDKNEYLPAGATFQSFGAFSRGEDATHDRVGCAHLAGLAIAKRILNSAQYLFSARCLIRSRVFKKLICIWRLVQQRALCHEGAF
jgi:hypothetical protein